MKNSGTAVGIVEFLGIAEGIKSLDYAVKNSDIHLLRAGLICPGGYLLVFAGRYADVYSAVRMLRAKYFPGLQNSLMIGNLSSGILESPSIGESTDALGIIETRDAASAVYAADEAVKTSGVWVRELRLANGIGGKGVVILCGGIAEIIAATEKASLLCRKRTRLVASTVVTNPHEQTCKTLFET